MTLTCDPGGPSRAVRRDTGRARAGFSLVELLCVMAILLILYALYFSAGSKPYQRRQQEACGRNLQFVHQALRSYALDHQGRFPEVPGARSSDVPLSRLVPVATTRTDIFVCPGSGDKPPPPAQPFEGRRIGYAYVMGLGTEAGGEQWLMADALVEAAPKAAGELAFSMEGKRRPGNNHREYGGMVLFADGRAERSPPRAAFPLTVPPKAVVLNPPP